MIQQYLIWNNTILVINCLDYMSCSFVDSSGATPARLLTRLWPKELWRQLRNSRPYCWGLPPLLAPKAPSSPQQATSSYLSIISFSLLRHIATSRYLFIYSILTAELFRNWPQFSHYRHRSYSSKRQLSHPSGQWRRDMIELFQVWLSWLLSYLLLESFADT